jgi:hypothetical protein
MNVIRKSGPSFQHGCDSFRAKRSWANRLNEITRKVLAIILKKIVIGVFRSNPFCFILATFLGVDTLPTYLLICPGGGSDILR